MYICADCQVELTCIKNGVGADFGNGHVYVGDLYRCPRCGRRILTTNAGSVYDPEYKYKDQYLPMDRNYRPPYEGTEKDIRTIKQWGV